MHSLFVFQDNKGFITVPVFFATNRNEVGGTVKKFYGTQRADKVSWGVMWLSLPDSLGYGETDALFWRYNKKRAGVPPKKIAHLTTLPLVIQSILLAEVSNHWLNALCHLSTCMLSGRVLCT
jgi:hypothetical protein